MVKFISFSWTVLWGCLFVLQTVQTGARAELIDNIDLTTIEIIQNYGYPYEVYSNVTTEDGYLLEIYRIPRGRKLAEYDPSRSPILLMHGLFRTSKDYVVLGPKKALGFLLADRGYDIWLPNSRETIYSRKHTTLDPETDKRFWNFSWHEIGYYDLATTFELMKNVTKKERFSVIGVSQGTTEFYVLASSRPEYNRNVTIMISLAPVAYLRHTGNLIKIGGLLEPIGTTLTEALGLSEVVPPPSAELGKIALKVFCMREGFIQDLCANMTFLAVGFDPTLNKTILAIAAAFGAGGSMRESFHAAQNVRSGYFRPYDYGEEGNLKIYGAKEPPSYDLSKITAPVALMYSNTDQIATTPDVKRLCSELSNCVYLYQVPAQYFNHFDFLIGRDVYRLVFKKVFYLLRKYDRINNANSNISDTIVNDS